MRSARQHLLRIADANTHPIVKRLDFVLLGRSVALDVQNLEWNDDRQAAVILIAGGKVAEDAALDLLAFDLNDNRFDHEQRAIRVDRDIACKIDYSFLCETRAAVQVSL
jgi:Ran GTPase-activating protein (RanGAP) involved in mRNA processing and transport